MDLSMRGRRSYIEEAGQMSLQLKAVATFSSVRGSIKRALTRTTDIKKKIQCPIQ